MSSLLQPSFVCDNSTLQMCNELFHQINLKCTSLIQAVIINQAVLSSQKYGLSVFSCLILLKNVKLLFLYHAFELEELFGEGKIGDHEELSCIVTELFLTYLWQAKSVNILSIYTYVFVKLSSQDKFLDIEMWNQRVYSPTIQIYNTKLPFQKIVLFFNTLFTCT